MSMGPASPRSESESSAQLGGVRADFVANLGRHISDIREYWDALDQNRGSPRLRDEVRRRIHALALRSRVLGFDAMSQRLEQAERCLERASSGGGIDAEDCVLFTELFRDLPSLAWAESVAPPSAAEQSFATSLPVAPPEQAGPTVDAPHHAESAPPSSIVDVPSYPLSVLLVGDDSVEREITSQLPASLASLVEVQRLGEVDQGLALARALAPDVVVVDSDIQGAAALVSSLAHDSLTEAVPVVAVGTFRHASDAARMIRSGASHTIPRPVSSPALARVLAACIARPEDRTIPPVGYVTVEQLASRVAALVRQGLVDAVRPDAQDVPVNLGEGTEVLAAVWSSVARIRELVTLRSDHAVGFRPMGPAGAIPAAPWMEAPTDDGGRQEGRRVGALAPAVRPDLHGRRALIVDDDPAVAWFLCGLLRDCGAEVMDAPDGAKGLELALRSQPDLVVTDILMPKLDGFALSQALRRDVVLRDVGIVLLSWKEDLLQRVRELGANVDGYLRKEAGSFAILRTIDEAMRPRNRVEARLKFVDPARGRLGGLSAYSLVRMVCGARPDATLSIRDATASYELQIRNGQVCSVRCTTLHGEVTAGRAAVGALLGISAGRFEVSTCTDEVSSDVGPQLNIWLQEIVARIRAAQSLLGGSTMLALRRIDLRLNELLLGSTPEPARSILCELRDGHSPMELVSSLRFAPSTVEAVLHDASIHGAVTAIVDRNNVDLLPQQTQYFLDLGPCPDMDQARPGTAGAPAPGGAGTPAPTAPTRTTPAPSTPKPAATELSDLRLSFPHIPVPRVPREALGMPPLSASAEAPAQTLEEAVIREVSVASGSHPPPSEAPSAMLDTAELRHRGSFRPSLAPDVIVPASASLPPTAEALPPLIIQRNYSLESIQIELPEVDPDDVSISLTRREEPPEPQPADASRLADEVPEPFVPSLRETLESASLVGPASWWSRWRYLSLLSVLAVLSAVVAGFALWHLVRVGSPREPSPGAPPSGGVRTELAPHSGSAVPPVPTPSLSGTPRPDAPLGPPPSTSDRTETGLPLPDGVAPDGRFGWLEVVTDQPEASVRVDSMAVGRGRLVTARLAPGDHVVEAFWAGITQRHTVSVVAQQRTRLHLEDRWDP